MTLVASNGRSKIMDFEDLPLAKPSKVSIKKETKRHRELNINQMTTGQIVWHLTARHRFTLVSVYAVVVTAALIIKW